MDYTTLEDPFKYDHNVDKIFSSKFTVVKNDKMGTYTIKNDRDLCLEFKFKQTEIKETVLFVLRIHKCGGDERSGRALITLIDDLAYSIPAVEYIELEDGSYITICNDKRSWGNIEINLAHLKILTSGLSWYNSFGYKSLSHDANVLHNARIINKQMNHLLDEISHNPDLEEETTEVKENAITLFPELSTDMTVKDYIRGVLKTLPKDKTGCTAKEINIGVLLNDLVQLLGDQLQYNTQLKKWLNGLLVATSANEVESLHATSRSE